MQCILCFNELLRQAQHSFLQTYDVLHFFSKKNAELPELVEGAGDVPVTYADSSALENDFGFVPRITLREGLRKFAEWYKEFYS